MCAGPPLWSRLPLLKEVVEAAERDQDWELVTTNDGNAGRLEAEGEEGPGISPSEPPAVSAPPGEPQGQDDDAGEGQWAVALESLQNHRQFQLHLGGPF